jgi:hypothetical protein
VWIDPMRSDWLRLLAYFCAAFFSASFANAQTVLNPKPSLDTTPVVIKVVDITYRIPRNYLTTTVDIPTIRLTWPRLEPLNEDNRECFGSINQGNKAGCYFFEFHILGSRGSGPGGRSLTNEERFQNVRKPFPNADRRKDAFGYEIYSVGPPHSRTEWYRQETPDLFFVCMTSGGQGKSTVCQDHFRLRDGNHMHFNFYFRYIEHIAEIENRMRDLLASFVVTSE